MTFGLLCRGLFQSTLRARVLPERVRHCERTPVRATWRFRLRLSVVRAQGASFASLESDAVQSADFELRWRLLLFLSRVRAHGSTGVCRAGYLVVASCRSLSCGGVLLLPAGARDAPTRCLVRFH